MATAVCAGDRLGSTVSMLPCIYHLPTMHGVSVQGLAHGAALVALGQPGPPFPPIPLVPHRSIEVL